MIWIVAIVLLLWGLWGLIKLLVHLFDRFQLDYTDKKEELLKEHNEPSSYQTFTASTFAFFHTIVRSPSNFFMVVGWIALGILLVLVMKGLMGLLAMIKDVLDFFLSGGRH